MTSNAVADATAQLDVSCYVVPEPVVSPDVVVLGTADMASGASRSLRIRLPAAPGYPAPQITSVRASLPGMKCTVLQPADHMEAATLHEMRCELPGPLPLGAVDERVQVHYSALDREGVLAIPVIGYVVDGIVAVPRAVSFYVVSRDQPDLARTVTLRSLRASKLVLDRIRSDHPAVTIESKERKTDAAVTLRVQLRPEMIPNEEGPYRTTIHVHSEDGGQTSIPVVVRTIAR